MVIAVKYSIVERPEKIDEIIYPEISSFLMLIKDNDRVSVYIDAQMDEMYLEHFHLSCRRCIS